MTFLLWLFGVGNNSREFDAFVIVTLADIELSGAGLASFVEDNGQHLTFMVPSVAGLDRRLVRSQ